MFEPITSHYVQPRLITLRVLVAIAAFVSATSFAIAETWIAPRFQPHASDLSDAVNAADVIFLGVSAQLDTSHYQGVGKGVYSGELVPLSVLKGSLTEKTVTLTWEPSATGIQPGSRHVFFVRMKDGKRVVVKEIFVHEPPHMCSRTYGAYDGGTESTLQTIKLLVSPVKPIPEYVATLLNDLKESSVHRQATAVRLACEAMRPECLEPLLYAISHQVEDHIHAIFGACLLDGARGAEAALDLIASEPDQYHLIFQAIAAAKNVQSVPALLKYGEEFPEYRASCNVAIGEIFPARLPDLIRLWKVDGKKGSHLRHFEGWVVKRESGGFDLSNGFFCASFPKEKTASLAPHLGRFVDVTFSETEGFHGFGRGGMFQDIQRIRVVEETPKAFPILVTIQPVKELFASSEPIVAKVTLENRSEETQPLALTSSHAILSKDYQKVFWLEPDNHYYPEKSYRFEGNPYLGNLAPGAKMVFTIESRHMAEPGKYDLSYVLSLGARRRECVSKYVDVEVAPTAGSDRKTLLRSWLKTAALEQRIKIANELAEMGDVWAVDEFLAQLKSGIYLGNGFFYHQAFVFPFKHGGDAGEKLMKELIEHGKFQESVQEFIQDAFQSKNRLRLFAEFLSCRNAVEMNLQDWVEHPRVCDIAADVLITGTRGKMQFPRKGSEKERDDAVALVKRTLESNPALFGGLRIEPSAKGGR